MELKDEKAIVGTAIRKLTGGTVSFNPDLDVVTIAFSPTDLNAIKLDEKLAVTGGKIYFKHSDKIVADLQGLRPDARCMACN